MATRAIVLTETDRFERVELPTPEAPEGGAVLEVELTGLCGTDVKIWRRTTASARPLVMGHEILGRLVAVDDRLRHSAGVQEGDRVVLNAMVPCWACERCWSGEYRLCPSRFIYGVDRPVTMGHGLWGGFAEHVVVAPGSLLHPVSPDVPGAAAVLLGVLANGFDWTLRNGEVGPGSVVLIQGAGPQGLACALAAKEAGARFVAVTGLGRDASRLALIADLTGAVTVDVEVDDPVAVVRDHNGGALASTVVDVSGAPAAFDTSVAAIRDGGTIVLAGLSGEDKVTPVHADRLVWKDVTVRAAISKRPEAFTRAREVLESGRYALERIVTHEYALEDAEAALTALGSSDPAALPMKAVLTPVLRA